MSSEPSFDLHWATPGDEPEIRALVGAVPMPGAVAIRFAREPDYFLGASIMGNPCEVLVARYRPDGRLAGIACRAERRAYVNGKERRIGYIGQIRVAPDFRGHWLVHRGVKWFREASPPGLLYMGVIAGDNPRARKILLGEAGLANKNTRSRKLPMSPHTKRVSGLTTCAILLRPQRVTSAAGIVLHPGSVDALPAIVAFLREQGSRRQFFPAYTLEDFTGGETLRGLSPQDIQVAYRGENMVGVMATWDQATYKQDIVEAYGPALRRLRPAYNLAAWLLRAQPLTPPGQPIPLAFAACICIAEDDPLVMRLLLSACCERARQSGKAFLMIGLADNDPLLDCTRRTIHITYHSDLFAASWSAEPVVELDGRLPYIEIATL